MAGLLINQFTAATLPLSDGNLVGVGQGSAPTQTYYSDIVEVQKYIQRKFASTPNNMLGGHAVMINGVLTPSVATNNLTIALKTLAGNDPNSFDPVFIVFRATSTIDGGYIVRSIVGATSFTINSPNTMGISTGAAELFIVGIDDTGPTFRIGVVNPKITATQVFVVDEWSLKSATAGNGGNSAGTIYANTTVTNRPIINLGFMRWNNFATPGTWTLPTSIQTVTASSNVGRIQETVNDYLSRFSAKANLDSPTFLNTPAVPTPGSLINTTQIVNGAYLVTYYAPLSSPAFTNIPTAPTAPVNTSTNQLSTTAFVLGQAATAAPLINGTATIGTSTLFARQDHVHPTDTTRLAVNNSTSTGTSTFAKISITQAIDSAGSTPGHIDLYANLYGFGITSNQLNYIGATAASHRWWSGTTSTAVLDSAGNLLCAGNVTAFSDPRLKTDITPLKEARDLVKRLQAYRFTWNEKSVLKEGKRDIGLLSTEVKNVLPEFVVPSLPDQDGNRYETVAYDRIVAVLISAFNEANEYSQSLEARISKLESMMGA
jgi:hypothetical protein